MFDLKQFSWVGALIFLLVPQGHAAQSRFLEEVIVTAEKVAKGAQETPIAVTAMDEQFIEDVGMTDVDDMSIFIPSFSRTTYDLAIRGIGRHRVLGGEVGVPIYQNGIYVEEAVFTGSENRYYDLARVEVLRGPQGTLYGRNAIGGVVNYVFNGPTPEFSAEMMARGGAHNTSEYYGYVSGPLIDGVLAARLVGSHFYQGADRNSRAAPGHTPISDTGRSEDSSVSFSADWTPADNMFLSLRASDRYLHGTPRAPLLIGEGTGDRTQRSSAVCFPVGTECYSEPVANFHVTPALNPNAHQNLPISGNGFGEDLDNVAYPDTKPDYQVHSNTFFLDGQWHLDYGRFTLRYLAGYIDFDAKGTLETFSGSQPAPGGRNTCLPPRCTSGVGGELIGGTALYAENPGHQLTHELQLISNLDGRFNFVAGYFYQKLARDLDVSVFSSGHLGTYRTDPSFGQIIDPNCCPQAIGPVRHNVSVNTFSTFNLYGGSPGGEYYWWQSELDVDAVALYSQINVRISEHWELSLGTRWSRDEKTGRERRWLFLETADTGLPLAMFNQLITTDPVTGQNNGDPLRLAGFPFEILDGVDIDDTWEKVTGHLSLSWKPNPETLVYGSVTLGYRSGGFNFGANQPVGYEEEDVVAYELGIKTQRFDNRLRLNLNAYRYDYDNHQVRTSRSFPTTIFGCSPTECPGTSAIPNAVDNVPRAENWGTETEVIYAALDSLTLGLTHSYTHTEITSDFLVSSAFNPWFRPTGQTEINARGAELIRAPKNKFTVWGHYNIPLGDRGRVDLLAIYAYVGEQRNDVLDFRENRSPAFERWDFRASWDSATGKYRVAAFVKNITNELGIVEMFAGANQARLVETTAPRTWGLEFRVRFGNWNQTSLNTMMAPDRGAG